MPGASRNRKKTISRPDPRLCSHLSRSWAKINSESDTSCYGDLKQKFRPIKIRKEQEQFPFKVSRIHNCKRFGTGEGNTNY